MNTEAKSVWNRCLSFIKDNIPEEPYNIWLAPTEGVRLDPDTNTIYVRVPSQFFIEWIEENYIHIVNAALKKELGGVERPRPRLIYLAKAENNPNKTEQETLPVPSDAYANKKAANINFKQTVQEPFNPYVIPGLKEVEIDPQLNYNKNFETFVQSESNRLACTAGMNVAQNPGKTSYNPLFIFGGVGLGKTHLAHAIGVETKNNFPNKKVLYVEAEDFTKQYVDASVHNNKRNDFIHFYQQVDVLIIDNIQFFSGKGGTQDVLFHIINHLHHSGKQIILMSDRSTVDMQEVNQRLLSRFRWGLSAELKVPDYEARKQIIKRILLRDGVHMSEPIIDYIAANVQTNIRELEGVYNTIMGDALFLKREITMELAVEAVDKIIVKNNKKALSPDSIQDIVAKYFDISIQDLQSKTRKRHIVQARQLAMSLTRKYCSKISLVDIGKRIGGRNHATVLHAIKTVDDLVETDKEFKKYFSDLTKEIEG